MDVKLFLPKTIIQEYVLVEVNFSSIISNFMRSPLLGKNGTVLTTYIFEKALVRTISPEPICGKLRMDFEI